MFNQTVKRPRRRSAKDVLEMIGLTIIVAVWEFIDPAWELRQIQRKSIK